jgi:hypothetical protein
VHAWAVELRACLAALVAVRRARRTRGGAPDRLPAGYPAVERRAYAQFLWLRDAWAAAAKAVGLQADVAATPRRRRGGGGKAADDDGGGAGGGDDDDDDDATGSTGSLDGKRDDDDDYDGGL